MTTVLDSWAVLRYLEGTDPTAGRVERLLQRERPTMSWINLGEVFYVLRRSHGDEAAVETVRDIRASVNAEVPTAQLVVEAARIKADYPMAYADAFAAATAVARNALVWTGDPELLIPGAPWRWRDIR